MTDTGVGVTHCAGSLAATASSGCTARNIEWVADMGCGTGLDARRILALVLPAAPILRVDAAPRCCTRSLSTPACARCARPPRGVVALAEGCYAALRNPSSHDVLDELPEVEALEQLAAFSLLARFVDRSEVRFAA